jgi:predicted nucleic acid-binding protein
MKWLLDTNVLSETRRPRPDLNVTTFLTPHPLADFYISSVTVAAIRFGIVTATDTVREAQLEALLKHDVRRTFQGRVLEISEDIMLC